MKINIPKRLFEKKSTVTPVEFLEMFAEMVQKIEKLEEDLNYERETDFKAIHENKKLKERIKELEEQLKNKGERMDISADEVINDLKDKVKLRDSMGGNLYYNVINDECCRLANKCMALGADRKQISKILGDGTFY